MNVLYREMYLGWSPRIHLCCEYIVEVRRQELIFKIYTLVLHKFPSSICHPLHSLPLSPCFCTKTFIRSYRLPSLVIELNTTMHNGNASYELQNVCLFHLVKFVYILHLQLLFGSSIFMLFCIFYSGTVA